MFKTKPKKGKLSIEVTKFASVKKSGKSVKKAIKKIAKATKKMPTSNRKKMLIAAAIAK